MAKDAEEMGYVPFQIDGIPEGFCFVKEPLTIGGVDHPVSFLAYLPLTNGGAVAASNPEILLHEYNHFNVHGT